MKNYLIVRALQQHSVGAKRFTIGDVSVTPKVEFADVVKTIGDEDCMFELDNFTTMELGAERPCMLAEETWPSGSRIWLCIPLPEERSKTNQVISSLVCSSGTLDHEFGPDLGSWLPEQAHSIIEPSVEVHGVQVGYWDVTDAGWRVDVNLSKIHTAEVLHV